MIRNHILLASLLVTFLTSTLKTELVIESSKDSEVKNANDDNDNEQFCSYLDNSLSEILGVCVNFPQKVKYCPKLRDLFISISKTSSPTDYLIAKQHFCTTTEPTQQKQICCPLEGDGSYEEDLKYFGINDPEHLEEGYKQHKNWYIFEKSFGHDKCGKSISSQKILGGIDATLGDFPWMARIGYLLEDNSTSFECSGTIITDRYILTAAHCLVKWSEGIQLGPVRLADLTDSVDPEFSLEGYEVFHEDFPIEEVQIHPNYSIQSALSFHDIALIRLAKPIDNMAKDYFKRSVCLPFVQEYGIGHELDETIFISKRFSKDQRYNCTVAGWGKVTNDENKLSDVLQVIRVPLKPSIECRILYGNDRFSNQQLCVGGEENKNSCWGDSGSALTVTSTIQSRYYQIGIVSYGADKCGKKGIPTVYTRVRNYLKWILDTVRE